MAVQRKQAKAVLRWYESVSSRYVDLIGDYAGNELFIVEGDSLLLHCFSSPHLDLNEGFQLLHAIHIVERFLSGLVQRKCNFHLVFFDEHADLSIPAGASMLARRKYRLARAAAIRHLSANLPLSQPKLLIKTFVSAQSPAFTSYLQASGTYFLMCHDGALPRTIPQSDSTSQHEPNGAREDNEYVEEQTDFEIDSNAATDMKVRLRHSMFLFMRGGHNVALINGLTFRDTKVMTMVLEGSRKSDTRFQVPLSLELADGLVPENEDIGLGAKLSSTQIEGFNSESQRLVVATLRIMDLTGARQLLAKALILHSCLLSAVALCNRRLDRFELSETTHDFLADFASTAANVMRNPQYPEKIASENAVCDIADCVDGRLFNWCIKLFQNESMPRVFDDQLQTRFDALVDAAGINQSVSLKIESQIDIVNSEPEDEALNTSKGHQFVGLPLLPFSNPVFDSHMASIRIAVDENSPKGEDPQMAKLYKELTHWHVTKPLQRKKLPAIVQSKRRERTLKKNQNRMRDMMAYSASLTSAAGRILEPETIVLGKAARNADEASKLAKATQPDKTAKTMQNSGKQPPKSGKTAQKGSKKAAMYEDIAARNVQKEASAEEKLFNSWKFALESINKMPTDRARYERGQSYLKQLAPEKRKIVGVEVELFLLNVLLKMWIGMQRSGTKDEQLRSNVSSLMWNHLNRLGSGKQQLTQTMSSCLQLACKSLNFPEPDLVRLEKGIDRKLSFPFELRGVAENSLRVTKDPIQFQLANCGPYLDRSIDSSSDDRVRFDPDGWQRRVLDLIDANKSVFVVAPTSAGKTFISFYAMKKVLSGSDDGILVYVAPTKALVNQIAAEIQANFRKTYSQDAKSVWAIHTRDYRVNNPTGCQILVTVPHVLQILLLSPSNARSWAPRVKRIIFDEIHSIGQAEDGIVWEQLLLLAPSPIIALSATVGNPHEFNDWLMSTQSSAGHELHIVQHPHRYSDLRKYVFLPPTTYSFQGLSENTTFGNLGLDHDPAFALVHPIASLVNKARGIPADLSLEPRDCLQLWKSMKAHETARYPVDEALDPAKFPQTVRKIHVIEWEAKLRSALSTWMADPGSPFDAVYNDLSSGLHTEASRVQNGTKGNIDFSNLNQTILPLVSALHSQGALPAILFNYDRGACEKMCNSMMSQLQEAESDYKESNPRWKKKLADWEQFKKVQEGRAKKASSKPKKGGKAEEGMTKADMEREAGDVEIDPLADFDPNAPLPEFSFANKKMLQASELVEYMKKLQWAGISPTLSEALNRGIGVHHAGMNLAYRQCVEMLFRKGFLTVVIATGTLALGINMPCKTVVFSGDSVFLTALNFRQAAGRAGRRGFDLLGNVVFQGVPLEKVFRLISSRLPDLNGHFPITTSLILRLCILLGESKGSPYAKNAINSLLSQPRLYYGGSEFKEGVLHHLRFSIEYLRRQALLDASGAPLNFAGCVSHLYYTENSSFAFHALLKEGYFHKLASNLNKNSEENILRTLMLVMTHLFGRRPCRQAEMEPWYYQKRIHRSPSVVFLPPMPTGAEEILKAHNSQTLQIFSTYVKTFAEQHLKNEPDDRLPLTNVAFGGIAEHSPLSASSAKLPSHPPTTVRSAFTALSGHGDQFTSINDLCSTVRSGVFLEESAIPHIDIYPAESPVPLNAYLYDFFKHGDTNALEIANGIRKGDVWYLLNDFSLVLATIVTSFRNFMGLDESVDLDMTDVKGSGEAHEEKTIDEQFTALEGLEQSAKAAATAKENVGASGPAKSKKKKVADSWDDDGEESGSSASATDAGMDELRLSDEETAAGTSRTSVAEDASSTGYSTPAWQDRSAGGATGMLKVLKAFERLKEEFDVKFRAMWA